MKQTHVFPSQKSPRVIARLSESDFAAVRILAIQRRQTVQELILHALVATYGLQLQTQQAATPTTS